MKVQIRALEFDPGGRCMRRKVYELDLSTWKQVTAV